jgi:predicted ArsR family transcriptional regulator
MVAHSASGLDHALTALADPSRRAVFEFILGADRPVSRDDVAEALGMVRGTAAFHLDRLAKEKLLEVTFRRLTGRSGPGAGRPTKLYAPAVREVSLSLPPRHYDLAAELLAAAVEDSARSGAPVEESLQRVAARAGRTIGDGADDVGQVLERHGYRPRTEEDGSISLLNCPFHRLAQGHTSTICGLNLDLLAAVAETVSPGGCRAVLDPAPGRCCVRLLPPDAD